VTSAEISGRAMARNELAGALAGWDNEGGSVRSEANAQMVLDEAEERILRCLGAAVIVQWNELPTEIQRRLFQHAATMGEPRHAIRLKEEIARFLHDHKDDATAEASVTR
jgi:hypothetical protein